MNEKWYVAAKKADFQGIAKRFGIDPVTARIIRNRDVVGDDEIRQYLYGTRAELGGTASGRAGGGIAFKAENRSREEDSDYR